MGKPNTHYGQLWKILAWRERILQATAFCCPSMIALPQREDGTTYHVLLQPRLNAMHRTILMFNAITGAMRQNRQVHTGGNGARVKHMLPLMMPGMVYSEPLAA